MRGLNVALSALVLLGMTVSGAWAQDLGTVQADQPPDSDTASQETSLPDAQPNAGTSTPTSAAVSVPDLQPTAGGTVPSNRGVILPAAKPSGSAPTTAGPTTTGQTWPSFASEPASGGNQRGANGIYTCAGAGLNLRNCGP